jgi:uncharacterized protein (DUF736 family)
MKLTLFVWKNKDKKEDKEPDYRVTMANDKGGFQPFGGGWIKTSKTGDKFISIMGDTETVPFMSPEEKAKLDKARDEEVRAKFTSKQDEEINASDVYNNF